MSKNTTSFLCRPWRRRSSGAALLLLELLLPKLVLGVFLLMMPPSSDTMVATAAFRTLVMMVTPRPSHWNSHRSVTTINEPVRNIMKILQDRYPNAGSTKDWKKLRNYLYRATSSTVKKKNSNSSNNASTVSSSSLRLSQVYNVLKFLDEQFISDSEEHDHAAAIILQQSPRILQKNVRTKLRPTMEFLEQLYGPDTARMAVIRNPDLLLTAGMGYNDSDLDLVRIFLQNELQLSESQIRKLQNTSPNFFQMKITQLLSVTDYFQSILSRPQQQQGTGNSKSNNNNDRKSMIAKLVVKHPELFSLSVQDNLQPRMEYLQRTFQLRPEEMSLFLKPTCASVLGLSVSDNLVPTVSILMEPFCGGGSTSAASIAAAAALGKTVKAHPQILALSQDNIRAKVEYFDSLHYNMTARILTRAPAVFSLSLEKNLIPTVEFLAELWQVPLPSKRDDDDDNNNSTAGSAPSSARIHDDDCYGDDNPRQLCQMISEYPSILTMSLRDNLQPTVQFYQNVGYDVSTIRGRYLASSLPGRLLPRYHFYILQHPERHNTNSTDKRARTSPPRIPLHILAGATDSAFCQHLGCNLDAFRAFCKESIPSLKLNAQLDTWLPALDLKLQTTQHAKND